MKTNHPFYSTPSRWATALLVAAAAVTLTISTQAAPGGGGGSSSGIPVIVEFDPGGNIRGDGDGTQAYTNGVGRTTAVIDSNGMLDLSTNSGNKPGGRKLHIDLSDAVTSSVPNCGATGGFPDYNCDGQPDDLRAKDVEARVFTLNDTTLVDGIINLRTLLPGALARGGLAISFGDFCGPTTGVPWRLRFMNNVETPYPPCADSTIHVVVEALDENTKSVASGNPADTWLISPEDVSGQASLFSGGTGEPVLREIVRVPFIMMVKLK